MCSIDLLREVVPNANLWQNEKTKDKGTLVCLHLDKWCQLPFLGKDWDSKIYNL